ncbi:MAG: dockerin type I repeat-containing protein, partial [Clostridia bacterium]|nr:dockerin type I repeat-containing protein [Clostridia bacterium]
MIVPENVYAIQETVTELVEEKEAEVMEAQAYTEEQKNSEEEIILGDANGDKQVNISDLLVVLRHISATTNNKHPEWILKDEKLKAADINKDGKVNSIDMLVILRYISAKSNPEIAKKHSDWLII